MPLASQKIADAGAHNGIDFDDEDPIFAQALTCLMDIKSDSRASI